MIKIKNKLRDKFSSLYLKLMWVILLGIFFAGATYVVLHFGANYYITNYYTSEENRTAREEQYIKDLQSYVTSRGLSSENTNALAEWAQQNRYVYLLIYKDNELFFTSDTKPEPPPTEPDDSETGDDSDDSGETGGNTDSGSDGTGDGTDTGSDGSDDGTDTGGSDSTGGTTDGEGTDENGGTSEDDNENNGDKENESGGTIGGGSGITVDYPTREELFKYAEENDLYPIELDDGTLFASLAEFTEYLYYDVSNIACIVAAMLVLAIILLNYFRKIISRIKRLESDVNVVAEGDMDHMIIAGGYDEISKLSVNVENMRKSILYNLEKEREARDANTELITAMSHDIRTPLTVLLGYLEMMRAEAEDGGVMESYIDASEKTALRLKQISDDMFRNSLAFGNTEEGIDLEEYNARMLLDQLLSEHMLLMSENGYKLSYDTNLEDLGEDDVILTDAPNLMRIIDNIFSNLYKYADLEEEVRMSMALDGDILRFTCANTPICDTSKAESNGIGLKTCTRLARFIANEFHYGMVGEEFVTVLELKIKRAEPGDERKGNK